ncbi:hypothetical protein QBC43DRAFT_218502 [Cladorrhinum sp. PSN259]|nr:hypothetical protein QBC43DRAFT_218502 [Cladorrhinum sp. PSN259]
MKYTSAILAVAGLASARDVSLSSRASSINKREVPQEHCHEFTLRATNVALKLNNPLNIVDAVFSLLGNAAAANGAGDVTDDRLDCLQQIIADQALTNAKAANDIDAAAQAILFRALERNTLTVGEASALCNETPVNAELAKIQQHQDPASPNAAEINKNVELEVAKALASIGADPLLALQSGTFAPGEIGDPTAAGNTCNDETDPIGCIISQNLLTPIATEAEILAAAAEVTGGGAADNQNDEQACEVVVDNGNNNNDNNNNNGGNDNNAGNNNNNNNNGGNNNNNNAGNETPTGTVNVQTFAGALGGPAPPVISSASARPFEVNGNTFLQAGAAIQRSCAIQKNACSNAANSGQIQGGTQQCDAQEDQCRQAASLRRARRGVSERRY